MADRCRRGAVILVGSGLLLIVMLLAPRLVPAAQAHAGLVSSSPSDGEALTAAPTLIELTFTDKVPAQFATVVLTTPGSSARPLSVSATGDPASIAATVDSRGAPGGAWRVDYRVTSADGHPIRGAVEFTVRIAPSGADPSQPAPTASPPSAPTASPTSKDPHGQVAPSSSVGEGSRSRSYTLLRVGLGVAALLAAAVIAIARRRRRSSTT